MNLDDQLRRTIEARTDFLEPWSPSLSAVRQRRRRTQTRRTVAGLAVAAGVVAAVFVGGTSPSRDDSTPPVLDQQGRVVLLPDFEASPPGPRSRGEMTSSDAAYDGSGELALTARTIGEVQWAFKCDGAPGTSWVLTIEPNATFYDSGRCETGQYVPSMRTVPPAFTQHGQAPETGTTTLRLFLTDQDPRAFRRCFEFSPPEGCDEVEPAHATNSRAQFGIALYDNPPLPVGTTVLGVDVAKVTRAGGQVWRLTTAVTSARGAEVLTYRVPPSTEEQVVQVLPSFEEGPEPTLSVDGDQVPPREPGIFNARAPMVRIPAGETADVTLSMTDEDPPPFGLVVFEHDP